MPWLSPHPCRHSGCGTLIRGRQGHCEAHRSEARKREDERRPSASARGYDRDWRVRRRDYLADNPLCIRCGDEATEVDHIVPLSKGGADDESNYQALCKSCHSVKTGRHDRPRRKVLHGG